MTKVIGSDVDETGRSHDIDMRSRIKELKSLLETPALAPAVTPQPKSEATADGSAQGSAPAAFSSAGSEVSQTAGERSEERRVGKECRSRWSPDYYKKDV